MKIYSLRGLTLSLSLLFCSVTYSQNTFQKTFGSSNDDVANWVANTTTGYIVAGYSTSPDGDRNGYLLNLDFSGNAIWQKSIGGDQSDQFIVVVPKSDGFVVLGETESFGNAQTWWLKFDLNGALVWAKILGDSSTTETANSMTAVSGNRYLITGAQALTGTIAYNSWFTLIDSVGNTLWSKTYETIETGNILRCNYVDNGVIYASGLVETQGGYVKLDLQTGNFISGTHYSADSTGALFYLQPTADSSFLLSDNSQSADSASVMRQWVNKITRDGQTLWSKIYSRPNSNLRGRIESAGNDNFLLTPYDNLFPTTADALLAKIDNAGNVLWSRNYGRPGADWLWKSQMATDSGFVSVGAAVSSNGDRDVLIIKTDADGYVDGCCVRPGDITAETLQPTDSVVSLATIGWLTGTNLSVQPTNANLEPAFYCSSILLEVARDTALCPSEAFVIDSVEYHAPAQFDFTLPGINSCDTLVHFTLNALPQVSTTDTLTLCPGDTVTINGQQYAQSDTVVLTFPNANGCDTIQTFIINVLPQPTGFSTIAFCDSITINGQVYTQTTTVIDTLPGSGTCDTIFTYALTLVTQQTQTQTVFFCPGDAVTIGGQVYTLPGTVVDTIPGVGACDTAITYTLVLLPQPTQSDTISFCSGDSITINGQVYTQPGTVLDTIAATGNACDTVITYTLTFLTPPTLSDTITFCSGDSITINGQVYTQSGTVVDTIASTSGGCDTLFTYTLTLLPNPTLSDTITFCSGDSITINGQVFTQSGTVTDTIAASGGTCDTIITYTLTLVQPPAVSDTISFCQGDSVTINGQVYTQAGTVTDTIASSTGTCDTIVTYTLSIISPPAVADSISFCIGDSITINGQVYTQSGTVTDTIFVAGACDTIVTYTLTLLPPPTRTDTIGLCSGDSVTINGQVYTQPGTVLDTIAATTGCDTVVTYVLTVVTQQTLSQTITFCAGDSITINGQVYTQSATVVDTIPGVTACDTIVTYTLTLLSPPTLSDTISFCAGDSITINGQVFTQSGTVSDTIAATTGCDTIITYTLTLLQQPTVTDTLFLCAGDSITINGQVYTQPGTVTDTISATTGCDTLATYTILQAIPNASVVTIQCPANITNVVDPSMIPFVVNFTPPTASSTCTCPGLAITQTSGLPSGSGFPSGDTQVCYTATDSCGQTASCCFTITVDDVEPCDVKTIGCMTYELLQITSDSSFDRTYHIRVKNNCSNKLIYTAIQLPNGVVAVAPAHLSQYTTDNNRKYDVRNPNFSPFYSVRFKSTNDSISGGGSDIFRYTLPAQSNPQFIHITSRLAPQVYYEAHLNTFGCPVTFSKPAPPVHRDNESELIPSKLNLFPNPTDGTIWVDVSEWAGKNATWRVLNSQGQQVMVNNDQTDEGVLRLDLSQVLYSGLFFFEIVAEDGTRETARFVLQH